MNDTAITSALVSLLRRILIRVSNGTVVDVLAAKASVTMFNTSVVRRDSVHVAVLDLQIMMHNFGAAGTVKAWIDSFVSNATWLSAAGGGPAHTNNLTLMECHLLLSAFVVAPSSNAYSQLALQVLTGPQNAFVDLRWALDASTGTDVVWYAVETRILLPTTQRGQTTFALQAMPALPMLSSRPARRQAPSADRLASALLPWTIIATTREASMRLRACAHVAACRADCLCENNIYEVRVRAMRATGVVASPSLVVSMVRGGVDGEQIRMTANESCVSVDFGTQQSK
jgi:hypothetical protein